MTCALCDGAPTKNLAPCPRTDPIPPADADDTRMGGNSGADESGTSEPPRVPLRLDAKFFAPGTPSRTVRHEKVEETSPDDVRARGCEANEEEENTDAFVASYARRVLIGVGDRRACRRDDDVCVVVVGVAGASGGAFASRVGVLGNHACDTSSAAVMTSSVPSSPLPASLPLSDDADPRSVTTARRVSSFRFFAARDFPPPRP